MDKKYIIGIDLGGTKIAGALSDNNGKLLNTITVKTLAEEGPNAVLGRIKDLIRSLMDRQGVKRDEILGIGIGSPGALDTESGIIIKASNLPGFSNTPVTDVLEQEFQINTYLENDANTAALGEYWFGAGKGYENFLYITVSTGIGGGIVIDGRIYPGSTSNAGEIGHATIEPHGPKCNCGNYGCLELYASGTAIARIANERVSKGEETSLKKLDTITSKEVFEAAAEGDSLSQEVIDYCMEYLGLGIANAITTLDPDMVILGGGVSKSGQVVFDKVQKVVNERCLKAAVKNVKIVPAGLGTDAGLIGALAIVLSRTKRQ